MDSEPEAGIYARESASLDRYVQVGVAGGRVLSVDFPEAPDDDAGDSGKSTERTRPPATPTWTCRWRYADSRA